MSLIKIVTDSTAYMSKEYAIENDIDIVHLSVNFCGETFKEGFPGEFEKFFNKLKTTDEFPTTSQPAIGDFIETFQKAVDEGKEVIAIVISSKLSGTYNAAVTAANMVDKDKITVIDSETTVSNLRILVEKAKDLAALGKSREEIIKIINEDKKRMGIDLTVDTLEYLKRGGRLSSKQAIVGSILNIKPIISLIDGKLESTGKIRGKNRAIRKMIERIPKEVKYISICHILNTEEAENLKDMLKGQFGNVKISIDELGPVIGSHLGPKAIGLCYSW
jgi:DegV family protein with EDD domain